MKNNEINHFCLIDILQNGKLRKNLSERRTQLKQAIREKLVSYNARPFQKREGRRHLVFEETEQAKLRQLPLVPYEIADWIYGRKVKYDCHITFQKNIYSCPYQYLKKKVDLKVMSHFAQCMEIKSTLVELLSRSIF